MEVLAWFVSGNFVMLEAEGLSLILDVYLDCILNFIFRQHAGRSV